MKKINYLSDFDKYFISNPLMGVHNVSSVDDYEYENSEFSKKDLFAENIE